MRISANSTNSFHPIRQLAGSAIRKVKICGGKVETGGVNVAKVRVRVVIGTVEVKIIQGKIETDRVEVEKVRVKIVAGIVEVKISEGKIATGGVEVEKTILKVATIICKVVTIVLKDVLCILKHATATTFPKSLHIQPLVVEKQP